MNYLKLLKFLIKAKDQHFLYVTEKQWSNLGLLIQLVIFFNKNYKSCKIYRKKYKFLTNIVVVGLKWSGKNVKRRTSGFAKDFISRNKNTKCIYCEKALDESNATTDHIVPISEGGNNTQVNLLICCFDCNNERGSMKFGEYLKIKNPKYKGIKIPYV